MSDVWASGDEYEPYIGRWSRLVAREFLAWLGAPPNSRWLDVGCGTGALSSVILETASPTEIMGIDPSDEYLAYARKRVLHPLARFQVGDARSLPAPSAAFDAVVAGLVLNLCPTRPRRWLRWQGRRDAWVSSVPMSGIMLVEWGCCAGSGTPHTQLL